jgi:hypothetical protein
MPDAEEVPWGTLAAVAGGVVALTLVLRGIRGLVRITVGEARYRYSDPDKWFKWIG